MKKFPNDHRQADGGGVPLSLGFRRCSYDRGVECGF